MAAKLCRKDTVHREWHQFASVNKLKHCFPVDTAIANKLELLVTPEPTRTWKYGCDMPLLHSKTSMPYMAFTMQMLLARIALGIKERFS